MSTRRRLSAPPSAAGAPPSSDIESVDEFGPWPPSSESNSPKSASPPAKRPKSGEFGRESSSSSHEVGDDERAESVDTVSCDAVERGRRADGRRDGRAAEAEGRGDGRSAAAATTCGRVRCRLFWNQIWTCLRG